jgi:AcrR family transcriptional regulator
MSDMRSRLVAAAVQVMREQGVARATTREIARAAGVSEGSIFNHFPTKADLLRAVFTEGIDNPLPAAMQKLWTEVGSGSLRDSLQALVVAAVRFYREVLPLSGPQLVDQREIARTREEAGERFGPVVGHVNLTRYLAVEQRLGRIGPDVDTALLALALLGASQQYAFLTLTTPAPHLDAAEAGLSSDPAVVARRIVDLLLPPGPATDADHTAGSTA